LSREYTLVLRAKLGLHNILRIIPLTGTPEVVIPYSARNYLLIVSKWAWDA